MVRAVVVLLLSFVVYSAQAEQRSLAIQDINIVTEQFPPYNYMSNGVLKGASTEIVQAALQLLKIDANISVYPWARAYQMAKHHPNTLIFSMAKTPERVKSFKWGGALVPVESCFFALDSRRDIKVNKLEDAYQYAVTTQREGNTEHALKNMNFVAGKNLFSSVSADSSYMSILTGRADLWGFPTQVVKNMTSQSKHANKPKLRKVFCFDVSYLYIGFSLGTPDETVEQFNQALSKIRGNGQYKQILAKYKLAKG